MKRMHRPFLVFLCAASVSLQALALESRPAAKTPDFVHEIAPILKEHCTECHSGDKKKGGFSLNTHPEWLAGSENGPVFDAKAPARSKVLEVVFSSDRDIVMPPPDEKRLRPSPAQLELLKAWVLSGATWETGYAFKRPSYKAPLKHRLPELPAAIDGRTHPLDRLLDDYLAKHQTALPPLIDDAGFARRLYLDLLGILPEPEVFEKFLKSNAPDKRSQLVDSLLQRKTEYTENWLSFWNDLLRNDYGGTGFITGGRKQISSWLYDAIYTNKPYDRMVRELVNPSPETEGLALGITWRGNVSASQTREIQFAQSISQSFLGLNLKCASCHDSFIDKWKLTDAYGLAAIYADKPVEIARCEKLTGKTAVPAWPFPELGQIDPGASREVRLKQLADLMTHPENGWLARTIVNRFWARLLGRGLVHPVDAMGTQPWSEEILDYLGWHLADSRYDLKATLRLITTSRAYQTQTVARVKDDDTGAFVFKGPRAKRLTAEQFLDLIWQLTDSAPITQDAPVRRGEPSAALLTTTTLTAQPVQIASGPETEQNGTSEPKKPAPVVRTPLTALRKTVELTAKPTRVAGVLRGSTAVRILVNGALQQAPRATAHGQVTELQLTDAFSKGSNTVVLLQNTADAAHSHVWMELQLSFADGSIQRLSTDTSWESAEGFPEEFVKSGKFTLKTPEFANASWNAVVVKAAANEATARQKLLSDFVWAIQPRLPARASLLKSDLLMRTLGRPNRDQIVTSRPNELSTMEALDLSAGKRLSELIAVGAKKIAARPNLSAEALVDWIFVRALARPPQKTEREASLELLGPAPKAQNIEDLLWTICMLPEFQLVR